MKLSTAFFIILVILLGTLGVASSASDFEHHEFLRRKEKKFVLNETENSSNKSVDLTKTGYYSKNCYGHNIKNNTEIIKCGPACSMYVHYKSCAVFLMVMESAKKDYRRKNLRVVGIHLIRLRILSGKSKIHRHRIILLQIITAVAATPT
ncbi:hypothetical protein BY996DRAFT_1716966 [Phakopsora pachyrhizi]|nr:hypothetical protein BY996DRAFT_1716966 [Phakopsora pachyrhizi]